MKAVKENFFAQGRVFFTTLSQEKEILRSRKQWISMKKYVFCFSSFSVGALLMYLRLRADIFYYGALFNEMFVQR